jgi:hypothetical protein
VDGEQAVDGRIMTNLGHNVLTCHMAGHVSETGYPGNGDRNYCSQYRQNRQDKALIATKLQQVP